MPALGNGPERFGLISRLLHWLTALVVLALIPLGLRIAWGEVTLETLWLFGLHKSLGFVALSLVLIRIAWHAVSPPPGPLPDTAWKTRAARGVHRGLYVLLVAMPITGWIGASATGIDTVVFGRWTAPRIAPVSEAWETAAFVVHGILAAILLALLLLHVGGALTRRDGTMRRMVLGSAGR